MDCFTKRPEGYAIPYQEALTAADALVIIFFCRFGVRMELHSDHGPNFASRLMQDVLERLGGQQNYNTPTPAVRWNSGTLREDDRGAPEEGGLYSTTGLGWEATHLHTGLPNINPRHHRRDACRHGVSAGASPVLWPDVRVVPYKERSTTHYAADLVERLHDNHHIARQHRKVARDRMKASYDQLANSAGFQEGDRVWQYRPTRKRGKSPTLQSCSKVSFIIIFTRTKDSML